MENNSKLLRITFVLVTVLAFSSPAIGQQSNSEIIDKDSIYSYVDKYPEFPGGKFAFSTFMYKNLKYPQKAIIEKSAGIVKVDFVVNKTGELLDLRVTSKGTSTELNNEVLRVMRLLPHFEPAVSKGKKVSYKVSGEDFYFQLKPCTKKEFYPIEITPTDCGLPSFSPDSTGVYTFTEKMPEYPGGEAELLSYIYKRVDSLLPPTTGFDDFIPYRVLVRFIINEKGKVTNPQIIRGEWPLDNKISLQILNSMPDWIPGEQNGKKVSVYYKMPIIFDPR